MNFKPFRDTFNEKKTTNKLTERVSKIALELEAYIQATIYDGHSMAIAGHVQWSFSWKGFSFTLN